jgi:hypothetical protein
MINAYRIAVDPVCFSFAFWRAQPHRLFLPGAIPPSLVLTVTACTMAFSSCSVESTSTEHQVARKFFRQQLLLFENGERFVLLWSASKVLITCCGLLSGNEIERETK